MFSFTNKNVSPAAHSLPVFKVNLKKIFAPTKNQLRQTAILHGLI
jgi:hypothetical protein